MQLKAKAGDGPITIELQIAASGGIAVTAIYQLYDIGVAGGPAQIAPNAGGTYTLPDSEQFAQPPYRLDTQPAFATATTAVVSVKATQNGQVLPDIDSPDTTPWHPLEAITQVGGGGGTIYPQGFSVFFA